MISDFIWQLAFKKLSFVKIGSKKNIQKLFEKATKCSSTFQLYICVNLYFLHIHQLKTCDKAETDKRIQLSFIKPENKEICKSVNNVILLAKFF